MARASIIIECGRKSGLGRVRRTLTLARALTAQGIGCEVYVTSDEGSDLIEAMGFVARPIDQIPGHFDFLIMDTCSFTSDEVSALCAKARTSCVIDDLAERPIVCDFVINPNLYATGLDYSAYKAREVFRGPSCALVDDVFFSSAKPSQNRKGFVVSFGGTDDGSLAAPVAAELHARTGEPVYVPIPAYQEPCAALLALDGDQITILRGADMPVLLGGARTYVGAAGATVLEALAAGCKVCAAATQEDQHKNVGFLPEIGVATLDSYDAHNVSVMALLQHHAAGGGKALQSGAAGKIVARMTALMVAG
ncbi:hypothetical protein [Kordiimonas aestuarii]|uniref:hypothetical protein n=1 Tax=Kordiimonas aestuarii TaxID=1005925 RepID=UPI0021D3E08D|nr:hypothetical protein [Kordiimonas aestuarii]